ncbi:DEAD/DEAH box helicase [Lactococcus lactis]|uniref:preprotein translocase subunit SecA n=1 Tax=Lactococcus lactis TaxID=1358 RepID=UPI0024166E9B|nr:DEAD/DEAH box helicase [Lactococcus lactis]MDG4969786.1 preprotein translocase subunit SecA [Lactococcus lactis]MDG5103684.1 preprotein translocase subunit SecA [Lactococcus lactis]
MNYKKMLKKINDLSFYMKSLTDEELRSQTNVLKREIKQKKSSQQVIIKSFSVVREANRRVLRMYPTDEQILGALVLYDGKIAEIKTGEGKSLISTMPLYLKSLIMGHAFLVTTNDYLAKRDYVRIGKVFEWLGLSVADGTNNFNSGEEFEANKKKKIYSADIIYISCGTLGFDFLINGLAERQENHFISSLDFALLDEVDEILLDNAQQPLIISGAPKVQSNYFHIANTFILLLKMDIDYEFNNSENQVWLTEKGIEKLKNYFSHSNLLDKNYFSLYQHIILALKAHHTLKKNRDYVVENGQVKLLDSKDGRILDGTNLQSGLHQAIEAKEGVECSQENQIISSITLQNLFRTFRQLSGMSGTVKVAEEELIQTYNLAVKRIKTHKKSNRVDHAPQKYITTQYKLNAAIKKIQEIHEMERPLLIIAGSVETSELLSLMLHNLAIPHNLLNAKSSVKESEIIKNAGNLKSVTVSTSMAGRGTDIKLTKESIQKGGLAVVITERLANQRVELQAKGRAGRQGEPGDTFVFESLEDEIIRRYISEKVQNYYDKNKSSEMIIKKRLIKRCFKKAQILSEEQAFRQRVKTVQYDEILKIQKKKVDADRQKILEIENVYEAIEIIKSNIPVALKSYLFDQEQQSDAKFRRFILDYIDYNFKLTKFSRELNSTNKKIEFVQAYFETQINKKREFINDNVAFLKYLKICMLKAIDSSWSKQIDALNQIRFVVQHRAVAQKDPILEFEKEAKNLYDLHRKELSGLLLANVSLSLLSINKKKLTVTFP